mgnify:FL=1
MEKQPFKVYLLGGFRLAANGAEAGTVLQLRGRSQHLLAYLILHRQAPQSRSRLAGVLWPDTAESQARTNLRKELHYLRRAYPPVEQCLIVTNQSIHWQSHSSCEVDVDSFETALKKAEATEGREAISALNLALTIYQDDLWPDCEEAWIHPEQERLRKAHVQALARMTQLLSACGEALRAIAVGQQWLQAEPLEEGAYQALMKLYGSLGDRATALRLYHQCMTTLQTELGVNPSPTTASIYQQLLLAEERAEKETIPVRPTVSVEARPCTTRTIVGRDDLLQTLDQWRLSPNDQSSLLLLSGEPGIGKTHLLEALEDSAQRQRWQTFWGSAFAAEQLRAYGVWIDLFQSPIPKVSQSSVFTQSLTTLFGASAELQNRGQLLDTVVQDFQKVITPEHPALLLLDDIHWLDEASTTLLHYVFRLLGRSALRIICAARKQELKENAAVFTLETALRRSRRLQEIVVPPLSDEAVRTLVIPMLEESSGQVTTKHLDSSLVPDQIVASSGGNPLFALEVARANSKTANNLQELIESRLQRLDGAARDLLPWAAALGRRLNPEILASAASYPPKPFLAAMEQLEQQQIVRPVHISSGAVEMDSEQGNYDFVHDLIRQAAYDNLSFPRRKIIHSQLAKTLKAQMSEDNFASQVAYHAGLAGDHDLAAQASNAAALRSLRLFAYEEVIQLVSQGLNHCQFLPSCDRLLKSAHLLRTWVLAGVSPSESATLKQQIETLLSAMPGFNVAEAEVIARQALTLLSYQQGDISNVYQQCIKSLDITLPAPQVQAEALAVAGACLTEIERDMDRAEALLLEAQSLATRMGLSFSDIELGLGSVHRYRGNYDLAQQHLQLSLQLGRLERNQMNEACSLINLEMNRLESHQPAGTYAQSLQALSPQLPQGSDGALAEALITLQAYSKVSEKQPEKTAEVLQSLKQALKTLDELDAQRRVVFVASYGAEVALEKSDAAMARTFSAQALQAAKVVDHPNDRAVSEALCLLSSLATKNNLPADESTYATTHKEAVQRHWQNLKALEIKNLSARAQSLIAKATEKMK